MKCENLDDLINIVVMQIEDEINEPAENTARGLVRELIKRYDLEFVEE